MHLAPPFVMAAVTFSLVAIPPSAASAEVAPALLQELRQDANAAFKAGTPAPTKKTPEQVEAEKKSIKSHCNALFARAAERDSKLPGSCE